jgi:hypothetical protein
MGLRATTLCMAPREYCVREHGGRPLTYPAGNDERRQLSRHDVSGCHNCSACCVRHWLLDWRSPNQSSLLAGCYWRRLWAASVFELITALLSDKELPRQSVNRWKIGIDHLTIRGVPSSSRPLPVRSCIDQMSPNGVDDESRVVLLGVRSSDQWANSSKAGDGRWDALRW